jgi:hypothetical protein
MADGFRLARLTSIRMSSARATGTRSMISMGKGNEW